MSKTDKEKIKEILNKIIEGKIQLIDRFLANLIGIKYTIIEKCGTQSVIIMKEDDWETLMDTFIENYESMKKILVGEYK